jgi:hypothetical protein
MFKIRTEAIEIEHLLDVALKLNPERSERSERPEPPTPHAS